MSQAQTVYFPGLTDGLGQLPWLAFLGQPVTSSPIQQPLIPALLISEKSTLISVFFKVLLLSLFQNKAVSQTTCLFYFCINL